MEVGHNRDARWGHVFRGWAGRTMPGWRSGRNENGDRRESSCQRVTVLILHLFEKSFGEAYREERRDQDSEIREE